MLNFVPNIVILDYLHVRENFFDNYEKFKLSKLKLTDFTLLAEHEPIISSDRR